MTASRQETIGDASTTTTGAQDMPDPRLARLTMLAVPLILLVPATFAAAFALAGVHLRPPAVLLGAAGWLVALGLRAPLSLGLMRALGAPERVQSWVVASSGPLEEGVRLLVLLIWGRSFAQAASLGIGWAAIEALYAVATLAIMRRTDPQAAQARQMLAAQGLLRTSGPLLGVLERIGATALHIGFTLLVAWRLPVAIVTALLHSGANFAVLRGIRTTPLLTELALLAFGAIILVLGLAARGRFV